MCGPAGQATHVVGIAGQGTKDDHEDLGSNQRNSLASLRPRRHLFVRTPRDIQVSTLEVNLGTEEGWMLLAEGLQSHPGLLEAAFTSKEPLESGRKEDLRVLWDALKPDGRLEVELEVEGHWVFVNELLEKSDGEAAWTRLCQSKDLSKEEWVAQYEESDGDAEEEDEGVEDDAKGYEGDEEDV